jgi:glucose-6-phosphate isomerase
MTTATSADLLQEKSPFMRYKATMQLQKLALNPVNLTQPGQLTPERLANDYGEACGYRLLYGTERVTDQVMKALEDLAKESQALDKMRRMQEGEVLNFIKHYPSEKRAALHTATRDFFDHPQTASMAKNAAQEARHEAEKLKSFMAKLNHENQFDEMIVVGIGGSDQGPRANYIALQHLQKSGRKVYFIANVDPDDAAAVLKQVNLKRTLVVAISKSGTTLETATNEALIKDQFKKAGLNPRDHFISVTMPGTPMDNRNDYMETFYLWDWVGGRYSTSSMVGGVILAFAFGFDVFWEFLRGAHEMDRAALQSDIKKNLSLLAALLGIWNHNFLNYPTLAIIPYSQALRDYPAHLQQVDMESNGKLIDQQGKFVDFQTGPILWGSIGTNAQHSYFQLIHQGTATIPLLIIGFKKSQYGQDVEVHGTTSQEKLLANLFAQSLALALGKQSDNPNHFFPGNRPTSILLGEQVTPYTVGALLAFYEHKVAFQGFIWGINSFDQEGVQLGKVTANQLIDHFAARRKKKQEQKSDSLGEVFLRHLDSLSAKRS